MRHAAKQSKRTKRDEDDKRKGLGRKRMAEDAEDEYNASLRTSAGLPKRAGNRRKDAPAGSDSVARMPSASRNQTSDKPPKRNQRSNTSSRNEEDGRKQTATSKPVSSDDEEESGEEEEVVLAFGEHVYEPDGKLMVKAFYDNGTEGWVYPHKMLSTQFDREIYLPMWKAHCENIGASKHFFEGKKDKKAYQKQQKDKKDEQKKKDAQKKKGGRNK